MALRLYCTVSPADWSNGNSAEVALVCTITDGASIQSALEKQNVGRVARFLRCVTHSHIARIS
jgi:hypothetical protein